MPAATGRSRARCLLAHCLLLCGCNVVLGIDSPHENSDGGLGEDNTGSAIGGHGGNPDAGYGGLGDGGSFRSLPPAAHPWATWPMPNPVSTAVGKAQSYAVNVVGFVLDEVTGLEWQRHIQPAGRSWKDAKAYCEALTIDGGGFRLPSRIELLSLLDFTASNPNIDPDAFPSTPEEAYWTASPFVGAESSAWIVNFGFSTTFALSDDIEMPHLVRCVRSTDRE